MRNSSDSTRRNGEDASMNPTLKFFVKVDGEMVASFAEVGYAIAWAKANFPLTSKVIDASKVADLIRAQSGSLEEAKNRVIEAFEKSH